MHSLLQKKKIKTCIPKIDTLGKHTLSKSREEKNSDQF